MKDMNRARTIGTTIACVEDAERDLGIKFSPSFRLWLIENNGLSIESVSIFPVFDSRDPRKTADSIVHEYRTNWLDWLSTVTDRPSDLDHLLPFSSFGTGDYYCFDSSRRRADDEMPVVLWNHETGKFEDRAANFAEFVEKLVQGQFHND